MKCPGQDSRYWDSTAVFEAKCPKCGAAVEFFKDDSTRKCPGCGQKMLNPNNDFGCASYCPYAEQCLGSLPPELLAKKQNLLKDRVAVEMKRYWGQDFKRIGQAGRVARYTEQIGEREGASPGATVIAAFVLDIGSVEAQEQYGENGEQHITAIGQTLIRELLKELGATEELTTAVCEIVQQLREGVQGESLEFKVLHDADLLASQEAKNKIQPLAQDQRESILAHSFLTQTGAELARKVLNKTALSGVT